MNASATYRKNCLTYKINYNMQLQAQHSQDWWPGAENVMSTIQCNLWLPDTQKEIQSYAFQSHRWHADRFLWLRFAILFSSAIQNCSATRKMTSDNDQDSQMTDHECDVVIFQFCLVISAGHVNTGWMKSRERFKNMASMCNLALTVFYMWVMVMKVNAKRLTGGFVLGL